MLQADSVFVGSAVLAQGGVGVALASLLRGRQLPSRVLGYALVADLGVVNDVGFVLI